MHIESFDLYNPPSDFVNNVYKYYNLLREKSPIHKNPDGSYILTAYKDLVDVYRNFKIWNSGQNLVHLPFSNTIQPPLFSLILQIIQG